MHREIEKHIGQFPLHTQVKLKELHNFINAKVSGLNQKISYGIPTFERNGKNFIHYAGYSKHIGLYPGAKTISKFTSEFERRGLKFSKGALQLPLDASFPLDLIEEMLNYLQSRQ